MHNYYFTFGTDPKYPYGIEDYVLIQAESESVARTLFQKKYPNRDGSTCLNFAFCYSEEEFQNFQNQYYKDKEPVDIITQN